MKIQIKNVQKLYNNVQHKHEGGTIMKTLVKSNGNLFPAFPSLLSELLTDDWFDSSQSNWKSSGSSLPAVNVKETNDEFIIEVAAPGMNRNDFQVELDNNVLTVSSQKQDERGQKDQGGNYTRKEFHYQSFQRSFTLPQHKIQGEKVAAKYADGILYVNVPKADAAKVKPSRQITVG